MWWSALLPHTPQTLQDPSLTDGTAATLAALSLWALQFTPRVACLEDSVVMEVRASLRLFGGARALAHRVQSEATELGAARVAWAPNSLAALALARAGVAWPGRQALAALLDGLPMSCLRATWPHQAMLARMGCRTLGDLRRLPRAGVARRFDAGLLSALDSLYGHKPQVHDWVRAPEQFDVRLELPHRVDDAPALLWGARRLLLQLCGWLAARHAGIRSFTLHWAHDAMRSRGVGDGGSLTIHTAAPTRDLTHLGRLLAEHLNHLVLAAPVGDLRLVAQDVHPLAVASASWLPEDRQDGEPLPWVIERLSARLGADRVRRPVLRADHRAEWMCAWHAAGTAPQPGQVLFAGAEVTGPQPSFLLPQPIRLAVRGHRPYHQGELQLLLGPQRVEAGWWDRDENLGQHRHAARDYWVARSAHAGLLWVFQTRLDQAPAWFLHGVFA